MAGKDWRQEEKQTTGDEMVGWHHQLNGHKSEQAPRVGNEQGSLTCCSPWGHKELIEQLNWTELSCFFPHCSFCGWFLVSCQVVALLKIKLPPFFFFWKIFHFFLFDWNCHFFPVLLRNNICHCISLWYTAWWFDLHTLWNYYCHKFGAHHPVYQHKEEKGKKFSPCGENSGFTLLITFLYIIQQC